MRAPGPLAALLLLAIAPGCHFAGLPFAGPAVRGSGKIAVEARTIGEFTGIEVHGAVAADVTAGEAPSLRLSGDDNLLPLIVTEVRDGRLVIETQQGTNISTTSPLKATITATKPLDGAEVSGASSCRIAAPMAASFDGEASGAASLTLEGLDAEALDLDVSGASTVTITGKARSLRADASGASNLKLSGLETVVATVDLSGASSGEVKASESLTGDISGASSLTAIGRPTKGDVSKSGAASITYRDAK
jgi:hypothetical protein